MDRPKVDIVELFSKAKESGEYLKVSAPMVRYSKLEFRTLLRKYGVDLCFTPMIVAKSFAESVEARRVEFKTNLDDKPLIAQFAACNTFDLCSAVELIYPYVDGVDINCGCPQKWAVSSGFGCALLKEPELLHDMIRSIKRVTPNTFSCSVKMRLLQKEIEPTIDLCRQLEACGITFLTVHGRTPWQKSSEPVNAKALTEIKKSIQIPLITNGDVRKLSDAELLHEETGCDGVMSARGLLSNPALFMGAERTPLSCIQDWMDLSFSASDNITFQCLHHHLTFMMEKYLKRKERVKFNNLSKKEEIYDYVNDKFNIEPRCLVSETPQTNSNLDFDDLLYKSNDSICSTKTWKERVNNGKLFENFKSSNLVDSDNLSFMGVTIFDL